MAFSTESSSRWDWDGQWIHRTALGKSSGTCHGAQRRIAYALVVIRNWATHSVVWSCSPAVAVAHSHSRSLFSFSLSLSRIWSVLLALSWLYCVPLSLSKIETLSSLSLSSCNPAFLFVLNHGSFARPHSRPLCLALFLSLLLHFSHLLPFLPLHICSRPIPLPQLPL